MTSKDNVPAVSLHSIPSVKFIDLFCGIGSFHYSFKKLGWECVLSSDIDESARKTYKRNYNMTPVGDILEQDIEKIPSHDVLCAGFPCQPFSQCGYQQGFKDRRGNFFFTILDIVTRHKPRVVILENVQALLNHDKGSTFKRIVDELSAINYMLSHKVLKCSDYGIPQMRKRLFIVAVRKPTDDDGLQEIWHKKLEKVFSLDEYLKDSSLSDYLNRNFKKRHGYTIRCGGRHSKINDRHNWDGYIVDGKEYRLTIADCLKLQGFPDDFTLQGSETQQWKQLGNTIPTIFTEIIGKQISKYLL